MSLRIPPSYTGDTTERLVAHHAFVQNLRRGHYELGIDVDSRHRLPAAFTELARAI
jgi:transposase, IS6 family